MDEREKLEQLLNKFFDNESGNDKEIVRVSKGLADQILALLRPPVDPAKVERPPKLVILLVRALSKHVGRCKCDVCEEAGAELEGFYGLRKE